MALIPEAIPAVERSWKMKAILQIATLP